MGVWNTATPAGSDNVKDGDDRIREMKTAIQEALRGQASEGTEAVFPGASPLTAPIFRYRGLKGTTAARPAFGQYGLYVNTTTGSLQRDSGSAWEDVAHLGSKVMPAGSTVVFYQSAAPTGWTRVTSVNDRFLRVVSGGSPGTTGGSFSSLAHTHPLSDNGAAKLNHIVDEISGIDWTTTSSWTSEINYQNSGFASGSGSSSTRGPGLIGNTDSNTITHGSAEHAYADVLIADKDAY